MRWRAQEGFEPGTFVSITRTNNKKFWEFWKPANTSELRRIDKVEGSVIHLDDLSTITLPTAVYSTSKSTIGAEQ